MCKANDCSTSFVDVFEIFDTPCYLRKRTTTSLSIQICSFQMFPNPPTPTPGAPSTGEASSLNPVAKLAIPRLKTDPLLSRGTGNRRVTRACQLCREKKIKCSGDQPSCTYCQSLEITCHYTGGKREQTKKSDTSRVYIPI